MLHPGGRDGAVLVTGAAGFIGSHLVDRLLKEGYPVIGVDNFVRGMEANLAPALANTSFRLLVADLDDETKVRRALEPVLERESVSTVWHMAANSDIQAGVADPRVDLRDTFMTTFNIVLLMRDFQISELVFASTSAIYGNLPVPLKEETGPLFPISNYGAMKLASEGLVTAATESHLSHSWICRFPNVVGSRGTHGIIYDLLRKLAKNDDELKVLGDGTQRKPYLHVAELIDAMLFVWRNAREKVNCYNVGPTDNGARVKFISEEIAKLAPTPARIRYTGGPGGWVGDVPKFSYSVEKLGRLGWSPKLSSCEAIIQAVKEMATDSGFFSEGA